MAFRTVVDLRQRPLPCLVLQFTFDGLFWPERRLSIIAAVQSHAAISAIARWIEIADQREVQVDAIDALSINCLSLRW